MSSFLKLKNLLASFFPQHLCKFENFYFSTLIQNIES